jgi:hypothetical protein
VSVHKLQCIGDSFRLTGLSLPPRLVSLEGRSLSLGRVRVSRIFAGVDLRHIAVRIYHALMARTISHITVGNISIDTLITMIFREISEFLLR